MTRETVLLLLPEILLIAFAIAIYMGGAFVETQRRWNWLALFGVFASAGALWFVGNREFAPSTILFQDSFSLFVRGFALASAVLYVLLYFKPLRDGGTPEMLGSLLLVFAGVMIVSVAVDLILIFVSLELISIPTYILLYLGRRDGLQQESAAKYFYLSVLSSAVLLYGFAFLYGATGSTNLQDVLRILSQTEKLPQGFDIFMKLAIALIFAGLGFRLTAVPFHFYAPDVYQGATHSNAALLSVVPKLAGIAALVRIVWWAMPDEGNLALWIAAALAVLSMTLGNVLALWQDNLRRMMAYSSIAHAGYLLIGFTAALATRQVAPERWEGIGAMLFYLCLYALATIGVFAAIEYLGRRDRRLDTVDDLAGLARENPAVAAMLAVFMFSLAGVPILAGFWGKFQIFGSALSIDPAVDASGLIRPLFIGLAIVGVLNAAISAGYYLRIVSAMYFRSGLGKFHAEGGRNTFLAAALCCVLTIALGLYPSPLLHLTDNTRPDATVEKSALK
jgi:NADH-quinone oxidoreductase subunit N